MATTTFWSGHVCARMMRDVAFDMANGVAVDRVVMFAGDRRVSVSVEDAKNIIRVLALVLDDISVCESRVAPVSVGGEKLVTQETANAQGDERIARFYDAMIEEARVALGARAPERSSWLDVLHELHRLTGTPLPEAV
jgi:hypothetical protein